LKLAQPIALNSIATLRHVADFYYWKGIPVVRKWPRRPVQPNSDAQVQSRKLFVQMHQILKTLPLSWHQAWQQVALPHGRSAEDLKRKHIVWALSRGLWIDPPDIVSVAVTSMPDWPTEEIVVNCRPYTDPTAPANTIWRFRTQPDTGKLISYDMIGLARTRQNYYYNSIRLQVDGFTAPTTQTWSAATSSWTLEVPQNATPAILLAYHKDGDL